MDIERRKTKVRFYEQRLNDALRRLSISNTVVQRWRKKLKIQERALLRELEAQVHVGPARGGRKFLSED